jgi:hypothetical protein
VGIFITFFGVLYICEEWNSKLKEFQGLEPRKPSKNRVNSEKP